MFSEVSIQDGSARVLHFMDSEEPVIQTMPLFMPNISWLEPMDATQSGIWLGKVFNFREGDERVYIIAPMCTEPVTRLSFGRIFKVKASFFGEQSFYVVCTAFLFIYRYQIVNGALVLTCVLRTHNISGERVPTTPQIVDFDVHLVYGRMLFLQRYRRRINIYFYDDHTGKIKRCIDAESIMRLVPNYIRIASAHFSITTDFSFLSLVLTIRVARRKHIRVSILSRLEYRDGCYVISDNAVILGRKHLTRDRLFLFLKERDYTEHDNRITVSGHRTTTTHFLSLLQGVFYPHRELSSLNHMFLFNKGRLYFNPVTAKAVLLAFYYSCLEKRIVPVNKTMKLIFSLSLDLFELIVNYAVQTKTFINMDTIRFVQKKI